MGLLDEAVEIPRKTMVMFFLIDTSGSMSGSSIGQVNDAMREVLPDLKDISDNNADAKTKIAVLSFSSGTEWLTPEPADLESYKWTNLDAGGVTDLGEACKELESKLNRNAFLQDAVGNYAPVIILISDGGPTDDFKSGLEKLKQNKWFNASIKVALGVEDADMDVLQEFTGNKETAIFLQNKNMLKKLIRFVSVTSSKIGSKKAGDTTDSAQARQEEVAEAIHEEMQELDPEASVDEGW